MCWGGLPVALKVVLRNLDAATLSWFRFVLASAFMLSWLAAKGQLPKLRATGPRTRWLLVIAAAGLGANYVFFQQAIRFTGAAAGQVLVQLSPLILIAGGVFGFKEPFSPVQKIGLGVMLAGFLVFLNERLDSVPSGAQFSYGFGLIVVASAAWAAYAMAQKQLLMRFTSPQIMAVVYTGSALALTPLARPADILALEPAVLAILIASALNTIVAYGAFAESLAHWESARVSAVIAVTPILTLIASELASRWWPGLVDTEHLLVMSYVGATLVVAGSVVTSMARRTV